MTERHEKYYNIQTADSQGRVYDSKLEASVAQILDILQRNGGIAGYERQVRYELLPPRRGWHVIALFVDFRITKGDGSTVLLECKGHETPVSKLKRRLFAERYTEPLMVARRPEDVLALID